MKKIILLSLLLLSAVALASCGSKAERAHFGITINEFLASMNNIVQEDTVPLEGTLTKKGKTGHFIYNNNGSGFVITGSVKTQNIETITIFHPLKNNLEDKTDRTFFDDKDTLILGALHAIYPSRGPLQLLLISLAVVGETEAAKDGVFVGEDGKIFTRITNNNANILTFQPAGGAKPDLSLVPRLKK